MEGKLCVVDWAKSASAAIGLEGGGEDLLLGGFRGGDRWEDIPQKRGSNSRCNVTQLGTGHSQVESTHAAEFWEFDGMTYMMGTITQTLHDSGTNSRHTTESLQPRPPCGPEEVAERCLAACREHGRQRSHKMLRWCNL